MIFKIIILSHCVLTVDYLYIVNHPFDEICVPSGKMQTIIMVLPNTGAFGLCCKRNQRML